MNLENNPMLNNDLKAIANVSCISLSLLLLHLVYEFFLAQAYTYFLNHYL